MLNLDHLGRGGWETFPRHNCGKIPSCSGPLWGTQREKVGSMILSTFLVSSHFFVGFWSGIPPEANEEMWRLSVWPVWCELQVCKWLENPQGKNTQGSNSTRKVERIILPTLSLWVPHKGPEQNGILPQLWQGNVSLPPMWRCSRFNIRWYQHLWMWLWIWFWSLPCPTPQTFWMCKQLQNLFKCANAVTNGKPYERFSDLKAIYGRGSQL